MLNIHDAMRLAKLLLPHTPVDASEITVITFGGKILDSMIESGHHEDYMKALQLITGKTTGEIVDAGVAAAFEWFIEGLIENKFLALVEFYRLCVLENDGG